MSGAQRGGIILRFLAFLTFVALLGLVYLARHPLLRTAGRFWIVADPIEHADVIVVIGDDNFAGDRASRAAELFRAGWAPQIVASGRMLRPNVSMAELIQRDLESRGVPAAAIVRFDHNAQNTLQEAQALNRLIAERRWHGILLVTSNYHTRRARYIFRKVFPSQVSVNVEPAQDSDFDPDSWWESRESRKIFFLETIGYCLAMWELRSAAALPGVIALRPAWITPQP